MLDRHALDYKQEDEHNTLRAWAISDYCPEVPLFVGSLLPASEVYQSNSANAGTSFVTVSH